MRSPRIAEYNWAWRRARDAYLAKHPLCALCTQLGAVTRADIVDHVVPHKGDVGLFWDQTNWQSLCKSCHDSHKQALEKSGALLGCDACGSPLDPSHHWNRGGVERIRST